MLAIGEQRGEGLQVLRRSATSYESIWPAGKAGRSNR
jgi:hypothetical protein